MGDAKCARAPLRTGRRTTPAPMLQPCRRSVVSRPRHLTPPRRTSKHHSRLYVCTCFDNCPVNSHQQETSSNNDNIPSHHTANTTTQIHKQFEFHWICWHPLHLSRSLTPTNNIMRYPLPPSTILEYGRNIFCLYAKSMCSVGCHGNGRTRHLATTVVSSLRTRRHRQTTSAKVGRLRKVKNFCAVPNVLSTIMTWFFRVCFAIISVDLGRFRIVQRRYKEGSAPYVPLETLGRSIFAVPKQAEHRRMQPNAYVNIFNNMLYGSGVVGMW
ncbi:hypothetical protein CBL_03059 [Carabus blaptoides fortunei]